MKPTKEQLEQNQRIKRTLSTFQRYEIGGVVKPYTRDRYFEYVFCRDIKFEPENDQSDLQNRTCQSVSFDQLMNLDEVLIGMSPITENRVIKGSSILSFNLKNDLSNWIKAR